MSAGSRWLPEPKGSRDHEGNMNPLQQILDLRNHKILSAKEIVERAEKENRSMTPEEIALFDKLEGEIKDINRQVTALQDHAKRSERLAEIEAEMNRPAGRQTHPDQPANTTPSQANASRIPASACRTRPLKAFKGPEADRKAYRAGMWARAAIFGDQRAAHYCVSNGIGADIRNALGTTPNTSGGFLIPEEFSESIIDLREQYGVFRRNCNVVPMGRDTMVVPRRLSGITIGPVGENPSSAISQSTPGWNQVRLTAKKAGGLVLMSTEVSEDAIIDLADYLADEFAYAFALFEDQCGFIGDGSSTYLGIRGLGNLLTISGGLASAVACATATHDTFAEVDATDLATAMSRLPEYAKMNAKWYCSSVFDELVFGRLLTAAGGNTIQAVENGRPQRRYMGYPIEISQVLPNGPSTDYSGLAMCYFGDLRKAASLGDRRDVRVFPSEHRYMDTDQIGVRGTVRFDIVNHDVGTTSVAGPIVALCGGAS